MKVLFVECFWFSYWAQLVKIRENGRECSFFLSLSFSNSKTLHSWTRRSISRSREQFFPTDQLSVSLATYFSRKSCLKEEAFSLLFTSLFPPRLYCSEVDPALVLYRLHNSNVGTMFFPPPPIIAKIIRLVGLDMSQPIFQQMVQENTGFLIRLLRPSLTGSKKNLQSKT